MNHPLTLLHTGGVTTQSLLAHSELIQIAQIATVNNYPDAVRQWSTKRLPVDHLIYHYIEIMNKEKYAIWYSTANDYDGIMENFIIRDDGSKFEKDFHLKDRFIDYDHAVIIWYGKEQGELGKLSRSSNVMLEEGFDFITSKVSILLEKKGIDEISYLFALQDFEYNGKIKSNGILYFGGYVICERPTSSWLDEILSKM